MLKEQFKNLGKSKEIAKEIEWYKDIKPFQNDQNLEEAKKSGELVEVKDGRYYSLIGRLKKWKENNYSPPYLKPGTHKLLEEISEKWAEEMNAPEEILAVTSLARSEKYQNKLRKNPDIFLSPDSSHTRAGAFDISAVTFYRKFKKEIKPVNPFSLKSEREIQEYLEKYKKHKEILKKILEERAQKNEINFIQEYEGTERETFHVAVNPSI